MSFLEEEEDFAYNEDPDSILKDPEEEEDDPAEAINVGDTFSQYRSIVDEIPDISTVYPEVITDSEQTIEDPASEMLLEETPHLPEPEPDIVIQEDEEPKPVGILDMDPDDMYVTPYFSEPETIMAMKSLGYIPEDLAMVTDIDFDSGNTEIKAKVLLELDKRRKEMINNVIQERNRIINGDAEPKSSDIPPVKGKKRRKKKASKEPGTVRKKKGKKKSKKEKPELIRTKKLEAAADLQQKKVAKLAEQKQKRAESRIQEAESEKLKKAKEMRSERQKKQEGALKRRNEVDNSQRKKVQKALMKLDEVEKRREKMRLEKMAELKRKRDERERKLKAVEREREKMEEKKQKMLNANIKREEKQSRLAIQAKTEKLTIAQRKKKMAKIVVPVPVQPGAKRK